MRINDLTKEIYDALLVNKIRSGLTVLGIVIGIASVIIMIGIGQGAQQSVKDRIQSAGSNLLTVSPGAERGFGQVSSGSSANTLTTKDVEAIERLDNVRGVAPQVSKRLQIVASGENTNTFVYGVTPNYADVSDLEVEDGSFLSDQHIKSRSKIAIIGPIVQEDLFGEGVSAVGQKIRINSLSFTVIGVLKEEGGSMMGSTDANVYVPLSTAQQFLTGDNGLNSIVVKAVDEESLNQLEEDITTALLATHKISDPELADFNIRNMADMLEMAASVTQTFTILLGAVAAISLIVGGIGIMNMMLTTVTERTREIGLRKAIGAKTADIRLQFLVEAMILTLIGGVIGVGFGLGVSYLALSVFNIAIEVTLLPVVLAFGVSATIGIVFGYYPAHKASKLRPIEALRYE